MDWGEHGGNILIVSGSVNPLALEQLDYAKKLGYASFTLPPEHKISRPREPERFSAVAETVAEALKRHKQVVMESVSRPSRYRRGEVCGRARDSRRWSSLVIRRTIGIITKGILEKTPVDNLVIFGGDTLFGIMEELNCRGIYPVLEICPGVVAAKMIFRGKNSISSRNPALSAHGLWLGSSTSLFGGGVNRRILRSYRGPNTIGKHVVIK